MSGTDKPEMVIQPAYSLYQIPRQVDPAREIAMDFALRTRAADYEPIDLIFARAERILAWLRNTDGCC